MTQPEFHALPIADLRQETPDAVSIAFAVPEALREAYRFTPGQYLTLRATIDGEDLRRSYSICAGLDDGELRVAVKGFLKRFPDYRLVSDKITFMDRTASRRPTGVPVLTH